MSDTFTPNNKSSPTVQGRTTEPKHHLHSDNEPLPGVTNTGTTADQPFDYTPEAITHAKLPASEEGDTQFKSPHQGGNLGSRSAFPDGNKDSPRTGGTNTDVGSLGFHQPSATDYPKASVNSEAQGIPTKSHGVARDTGAPIADRFESKGIHTGSQPSNDFASTPHKHGFTTIGGTEPGSTTFKPSDDTGGPTLFQHSLAGQNIDWDDPNKMDKNLKKDGTNALPGHTSGVTLKDTTEDRSVPHPEARTTQRSDDTGVKFAEPPMKDDHTAAKGGRKASVGDKIVGKAEQVMGKIAGDSTLQEKGAARAQHGLTKN